MVLLAAIIRRCRGWLSWSWSALGVSWRLGLRFARGVWWRVQYNAHWWWRGVLAGSLLVAAAWLFFGPVEKRTLWATVLGSLIIVGQLLASLLRVQGSRRGRRRRKARRRWKAWARATRLRSALAFLSPLVFLMLGTLVGAGATFFVGAWGRALLDGCLTLPDNFKTSGRSAVDRLPNGDCYGYIDTMDTGGLRSDFLFGRDLEVRQLEEQILQDNAPWSKDGLTVIWLGQLSCTALPSDSSECEDGRKAGAEREQLQALRMWQERAKQDRHKQDRYKDVHFVIADAGQDMKYADKLAALILSHRDRFGSHLAIIGGGDSRLVTRRAIHDLLSGNNDTDKHDRDWYPVVFVAPTLTADPDGPGTALVRASGYFQLAPPATLLAQHFLSFLTGERPGVTRLWVYQEPDLTDLYTTWLTNDLLKAAVDARAGAAAGPAGGLAAAHVSALADIPRDICGKASTSAIFFAGRWTRFGAFVDQINRLCGVDGADNVFGDGSVSRYMDNDEVRPSSNVTWRFGYYTSGFQCIDLHHTLDDGRLKGQKVGLVSSHKDIVQSLFDAAKDVLQVDCNRAYRDAYNPNIAPAREPSQIGAHVAPTWDSLELATQLLSGPSDQILHGTSSHALAESIVTVTNGQIDRSTDAAARAAVAQTAPPIGDGIPPILVCVDHLGLPGPRAVANCFTKDSAAASDRPPPRTLASHDRR
ncbi:MAG TPA: hypothetical protein VI248_27695 [Kineosporiaceae bacterium]